MIYLSGAISQTVLANPRPDLGLMLQPGMGNDTKALLFWPWAADNGCFAQGEDFKPGDWLEWLASVRRYRENCLFAVAPDVVGDADATYRRSLPYLKTIRQLGFKTAYVAQNGFDPALIPWGLVDCLFVGGDDEFKLGAGWDAVRVAREEGKWVHAGRVNSYQRLKACATAGVDSADGTFLKYGPDVNWPRMIGWLDSLKEQALMPA